MTRAVDTTGTKTKVCNCHQNNNFGPVVGKCYNHATQVPFTAETAGIPHAFGFGHPGLRLFTRTY